jgi:hypothetical protein
MENEEPKAMIKSIKLGAYTLLDIPSVVQDDDPILLGARKLLTERGTLSLLAAFNEKYPPKENT